MAATHLIKKYSNRRLYDTATSSHITLEGIRKLIVEGTDVRIVDDTSGEDITRSLLLQIIADQEQGGRPMLSADFLMRVIRLYGNPMQEMMGAYLAKSFDAFTAQQSALQEQMRSTLASMPFSTMQELAKSNLKAWQSMQEALLEKSALNDDDDDTK